MPNDYYTEEFTPYYHIEENHCPGTGVVGAKFDEVYEHGKENSVCWACNLQGENEIIEIQP